MTIRTQDRGKMNMKKILMTAIMCIVLSTVVFGYSAVQITENTAADSKIDVVFDGANAQVVYERSATIYYYNSGSGTEQAVAAGTNPQIDYDSTGAPHVAFESGNNIYYTYLESAGWTTPVLVTGGNTPSIAVDDNDDVHIAFSVDTDGEGYKDVAYINNVGGSFGSVTRVLDSYYRYYFYNPSLAVDSDGNYHIVSTHHSMYCGWGCYHTYYAIYATNKAGVSGSTSPARSSIEKNSVVVDDDDNVHIAYTSGGNVRYTSPSPWVEQTVGAGSKATIDADGSKVAITYENAGSIYYAEKTDTGFTAPDLVSAGETPVLALGSIHIYYLASDGDDEVFYATDKIIIADADGDGVADADDNCPDTSNADQDDEDGDGFGDYCDDDIDGDGHENADDCSPYDPSYWTGGLFYIDDDGDGFKGTGLDGMDSEGRVKICYGDEPLDARYSSTDMQEDCDDTRSWINPNATEVCDDVDNDCDAEIDEDDVCGPAATCGDGIVNQASEECDDGADNEDDAAASWALVQGDLVTVHCSTTCISYQVINDYCGDGVLQDGFEECDDGNIDSGDGCSDVCETEDNGAPTNDIPEFSTIGALCALLGASVYMYGKRK